MLLTFDIIYICINTNSFDDLDLKDVPYSIISEQYLLFTVMDCHAKARGSIPGRNGVFIELHVLCKGQ